MIKKTDFNTKVTDTGGTIPDVSSLVTKSDLTVVENKIPDVSSLVKKTEYNKLVTKVNNIDTTDFVKKIDYATEITIIKNDYFTNAALDARHKDLVQKTTFKSELEKVDNKASENSSKVLSYEHKLKQREDTINDLERVASYFGGKNYFDGDGTQNYLVFQGVYKYFEDIDVSKTIIKFHANSWISKELSDEKISSIGGFTRLFIEDTNARIKLKFDGSILREKLSTSFGLIANYYIVYRLNPRTNSSNIVLENCLFGKIKMTKNADTDTYKYQGHEIGFDLSGIFSHPDGGDGKNVIIFGVDMTNSKHANNKTKDVLVLGHGPIQKIDDTTIYEENMYSPNFTVANKTFCLSLHYNGDDGYLFVNDKEVIKPTAKKQSVIGKISLGNISADFNQAHRKSTGLYGYIYDFSVDYNAVTNDKIFTDI